MAYRLFFFTLALLAQISFAALEQTTAKVAPFLDNAILNPSCGKGIADTTAVTGVITQNTTAGLDNGTDCLIDATTDAQTVVWSVVDLSDNMAYLEGGNCEISMFYKGDASLYTFDVISGATELASVALLNASASQKAQVNFPCGDLTANPRARVSSTSASAAAFNVAKVYLGAATNVGSGSLPTVFSAIVSVSGTVSRETGDWIDGNCTWSPTGTLTCDLVSGVFTQTPNCVANNQGSRGVMAYQAASSTTAVVFGSRNTTTDAVGNDNVSISCQKTGADYEASRQVVTPDLTDLSGFVSIAAATGCAQGVTAASMTAFNLDNDCSTPTVSGNASAAGTKIFGFVAPNLLPGKYLVVATGGPSPTQSTSGQTNCSYEIYDGTSGGGAVTAREGQSVGLGSLASINGQFEYSSKQTDTTFQIRARRETGNGTCEMRVDTGDLTFTLIPLSQNTTAPILTDSVTVGGGTGLREIRGVAKLNCDASSSITTNELSMVSSIGNISTGKCDVTLTTGFFNSTPLCTMTNQDTTNPKIIALTVNSATDLDWQSQEDTGSDSTIINGTLNCLEYR